jgi:hypothetical protein
MAFNLIELVLARDLTMFNPMSRVSSRVFFLSFFIGENYIVNGSVAVAVNGNLKTLLMKR